MEGLITLLLTLLHFVNWLLQRRISGQTASWEKAVLAEYIKGVWRVQIRFAKYSTTLLNCRPKCFFLFFPFDPHLHFMNLGLKIK